MLKTTRPAVRRTSSYLHFADGGRYYTHLLRLPQKHGIGGCMKTKTVTCFIYAEIEIEISLAISLISKHHDLKIISTNKFLGWESYQRDYLGEKRRNLNSTENVKCILLLHNCSVLNINNYLKYIHFRGLQTPTSSFSDSSIKA